MSPELTVHILRILSLSLGVAVTAGAAIGLAEQGAPRLADPPGYAQASGEWATIAVPPHLARYRSYENWLIALRVQPAAQRIATLDTLLPMLEAQLSRAPTDAMGWVTFAHASAMRGGRFANAVSALRMSYYTGREEMSVSMWRIAPALWLLPLLPADLQREADFEIERMAVPYRTTSIIDTLADAAHAAGPDQVERTLSLAARLSPHSELMIRQRVDRAPPLAFP